MVCFDNRHTGIHHTSYLRHDIVREEVGNTHSNDGIEGGGGRHIRFADEALTSPLTRSKARELASVSEQSSSGHSDLCMFYIIYISDHFTFSPLLFIPIILFVEAVIFLCILHHGLRTIQVGHRFIPQG